MNPLVSIIIPCYNAEKWVAEAIQSALNQTWPNKEVIVIDDGSTDKSLEVIKSFGDQIRWKTGPNRGGNHARNLGFAFSKGEYIQYLDADDFLLPPKLERQVEVFRHQAMDIVYEDSQRFEETENGGRRLQPLRAVGHKADMLEYFLSTIWTPPPAAFIFKRQVLERSAGWREGLTSTQDWELHVRLAMAGARYAYLPGCEHRERRSRVPTVSTQNPRELDRNAVQGLRDAYSALFKADRLIDRYKRAIARSYFEIGHRHFDDDRSWSVELLLEAQKICPHFLPHCSPVFRSLAHTLGLVRAEHVWSLARGLRMSFAGPTDKPR